MIPRQQSTLAKDKAGTCCVLDQLHGCQALLQVCLKAWEAVTGAGKE